jgi:hypothetical protein
MLSAIIKEGLHIYSLFSKLFTMLQQVVDKDVFTSQLNPMIHNDIESFCASHYHFASFSTEPHFSLLSRFQVKFISINKAGMPSQHKSLAIWVKDNVSLHNYKCVIERIPSSRSKTDSDFSNKFSIFCQFPGGQQVLNSNQTAIESTTFQMAEAICAALKAEKEAATTTTLLPLTGNHNNLESPPIPILSPPPGIAISWSDTSTSSLVQIVAVARKGSRSIYMTY